MEKKKGDVQENQVNSNSQEINLSYQNEKESMKNLIKSLIEKYNFSKEEFSSLFETPENNDLPISIFKNKELSGLETITKYLKEVRNLKYSDIASLLNRDSRTIWSTYNASKKKLPEQLDIRQSDIIIPLSKLSDRSFSILESIVSYLKFKYKLSLHEIGVLLNRDDRTIWTVLSRFKKKGGILDE